ncbi:DMT family transporter [Pseudonocardia acaciae]|uniref:DMT family transporter n=1 Tax=Pseudonocardia acaciae TaxID=551276 RepID=UPI00048AEF7A|nr:DMT family transporter [Pseudonocardia acaciae]
MSGGWRFRLMLVAAAVGWGCATTATKYALAGFGPATMLVVKLAAASAVLWAVSLVRGVRPAPGRGRFALLGLFEPALAYGGLTVGLTYTTATNASLLGVTESIFVLMLAAAFLSERIRARSVLGIALAVAGVLALGGGDVGTGFNLGDLIVVAGSVAAAVYVTLAAKVASTADALTMTTYQFTFATAFTLPLAVWPWLTGREPLPTSVEPRYWLAAMFVGGVCFALSFLLYNQAIRSVPAGMAGVILNMVPVIGVLTAVVFLGESLTAWHMAGAVLVVAGIMLFPAAKEQLTRASSPAPGTAPGTPRTRRSGRPPSCSRRAA